MIILPEFISKRIIWIAIFLTTIVTAGILYYHSSLIEEDEKFLAMDFSINVPADNNAFLYFIAPNGKEKIEVSEGRFADGTKIFESRSFKRYLGWWKQESVGQSEQTIDKVRSVGGNMFYHLLEITDPAITNLIYEYQVGKKVPLKIIEVNGRRFTSYYRQPENKGDYQIYGLYERGDILWNIAAYHDKVKMQTNQREDFALDLVLERHPEFPSRPDESREISVRTGGKYPGLLVKAKLTTTVEKVNYLTYVITLIKEWQIKINGIQPVSYWKYQFFQNDLSLIKSQDNDGMINVIK